MFARVAQARGFLSEDVARRVTRTGRVPDESSVPVDVKQAFGTALEIDPAWHLRVQAAMQRHVDASVSKTINLRATATADDVRSVFLDAWRLGVKGITVYRDGSRAEQVLSVASGDDREPGPVHVDLAYTGGCTGYHCEF